MSAPFVSTAWLQEHLDDPNVAVVDGSYYLSTHNRDADAEYAAGHIPGAVRFDLDRIADTSSGLPHMLPSADHFAGEVGAMGISEDMTVVIYDGLGLFSAPRVWWTFRSMGAGDVRILEGGFPRWKAEGRPVETGAVSRTPKTFVAEPVPETAVDMQTVADALRGGTVQVVDARPAERFSGDVGEPRQGLRSGHMPGSRNLPFGSLHGDGTMKSPDEIRGLFKEAGVDIAKPIIASCGSGITAAVVALAAEIAGAPLPKIYDGSFAEWGQPESGMDVVKGPARKG